MPPLTRQQTSTSVHSWWSDSNPGIRGPTINLHAASKPLMRLMYHRQATQLIEKSRGAPLSTETIEILSSYLPLSYVFSSTKVLILVELHDRARSDEEDARKILNDSFIWSQLVEILESPSSDIRTEALNLVQRLAARWYTAPDVFLNRFVGLLSDDSEHSYAKFALSSIHHVDWPEAAQPVIDANMLVGSLTELLGSPSSVAQEWAFDFVGSLARHEFIESAVLEPLCVRLLSLLWGEDLKVTTRATRALYKICHWSKGARAVVAGKGFYEVERLLRSLNLEVREWSCWFLGRLACCEGILDPGLCVRLVRSLSIYNDDLDVIMALSALRKISFCFDGAQATVNANVLDHVGKLLASCNADIRQYSCSLVKTLAEKGFLPSGVHRKLVENLLSLLRGNENAIFIWLAIYALQENSQWADGAVAVAEANALGYI